MVKLPSFFIPVCKSRWLHIPTFRPNLSACLFKLPIISTEHACLPPPSTVSVRLADSARTGKYVEGSSGTNFCPAGSEQISSEASCKAAAASALNTYYEVTVNNSESPRGCYGARGNPDMWCGVPHTPNCTLVYFNLHATGSGSTDEHHPDGSYFPVCLRTGQWW